MLRVGVIGCGEIANKHISFIKEIENSTIVGISDKDNNALKKTAQRYNLVDTYSNATELINKASPDVVHILTPPFSHKDLAIEMVQEGVNVYIEKPVALNLNEIREIFQGAKSNGVKVCAGYNHLFDPCMIIGDRAVKEGKIGEIIYVESYYGMNVLRRNLQKTTDNNGIHWSYELPGGLFHNYIDHPLYLLLKYVGRPLDIHVVTSSHGTLPQNLADELRVLIKGEKALGLLVISFTAKPQLHFLNIYGSKGTLRVNFDTMSTVAHGTTILPKAVSKATFNLSESFQLTKSTLLNTANLLTGRLKPYQGMKNLIEQFYGCLLEDHPCPVPEELVLNTGSVIDEVWHGAKNLHLNHATRNSKQVHVAKKERILVTGASGFLGIHTVRRLVEEGYYVRAFVRKLSYIDRLEGMGVEIQFGDVRDPVSFGKVIDGTDVVVHLAAETDGDPELSEKVTVDGTKLLINLVKGHQIKKVIYMSSMSVYDTVHTKRGEVITEESPLEPNPEKRGPYAHSKWKAEKLFVKAMEGSNPSWTILRPAMIFGPETNLFFAPVGVSIKGKFYIIFGGAKRKLRLVHVQDVAEAIVLCVRNSEKSDGKLYNLVHGETISKKEYLEKFFYPKYGNKFKIFLPYTLMYTLIFVGEKIFGLLNKRPPLTRYRFSASQKELIFSSERIREEIAWSPKDSLRSQIEACFKDKGPDSSKKG
jgi:nucleoside-diphosphate-sugar epimerase/predicted dehydrogenase